MIHRSAYLRSIELLKKASIPAGFTAAVQEHDNYKRVWTRDGTICSLAAILSGDETLIATAAETINTIFSNQHEDGFIPSNVDSVTHTVSYGGIVGRTDNPAWAIIGLCSYSLFTNDLTLAEKYEEEVSRCFALMNAWEYNGRHLLYVPQSGDWADEYIQHGYILFSQLLRLWALRLAGRVYNKPQWIIKADTITALVRDNYWPRPGNNYYFSSWHKRLEEAFDGYWLMGFNPGRVYPYFDLQANALALLLNIGSDEMNAACLQRIEEIFSTKSSQMLPSFYPAIDNDNEDMKELLGNHAFAFRNYPHQFHNGGLWAVWNGMMAAAFSVQNKKAEGELLTAAIHEANAKDNGAFNECLNGQTSKPCGVNNCAWSAAGAVIAEQALQGNFLITS